MLRDVLNKSLKQYPKNTQLNGHISPILQTTQVKRTRHVGHCWGIKEEIISEILLWAPTHGQISFGRLSAQCGHGMPFRGNTKSERRVSVIPKFNILQSAPVTA